MWKNKLQEFCQKHAFPLPVYNTQLMKEGSITNNNIPEWCSSVKVQSLAEETGVASGKKIFAEQEAARKLCLLLDRIESPNSSSKQVTCRRPANKNDKTVIFVDADHISFIDTDMVTSCEEVEFRFYFAFGANLPHLQRLRDLPNVSQFQAPCPVSDIADVMICIDVAQTSRDTHCIVLSKDKMLYNLSLLLSNVTYLSTREQFYKCLCIE